MSHLKARGSTGGVSLTRRTSGFRSLNVLLITDHIELGECAAIGGRRKLRQGRRAMVWGTSRWWAMR
jgi:hypothetical protein